MKVSSTAPGKLSLKLRTKEALEQVATDLGLLLVDPAEHTKAMNALYDKIDQLESRVRNRDTELLLSDAENARMNDSIARMNDGMRVVRDQAKTLAEESEAEVQQRDDRIAVLETQLCAVRQSDDEAAHQARTLVLDLSKSLDAAADMIVTKDEVIAVLEERLTARDRKVAEFREATALSIQARDADRLTIASLRAHNCELAIAKYERDEENTALKSKLAKVADELEMTENLYDALLAEVNGETAAAEEERDAVIEHFSEHVEATAFTQDYAGELENEVEAMTAFFTEAAQEDLAYIAHLEAEITTLETKLSAFDGLLPSQVMGLIRRFEATSDELFAVKSALLATEKANVELTDAVGYAEKLLCARTKERRAAEAKAEKLISFDPLDPTAYAYLPMAITTAFFAAVPK